MATSVLEFLISAKDEASDAFEKVGKSIEKQSGSMDKLKAASGVAMAGAGIAVVDFAKKSVDAYEDAQKKQALLEDAYKRFPAMANVNIDALRKLNGEIQKKTGYDDDDIAASEATLAQYKLTGDQVAKLAPLVADYAAKTGSDLPTAAEKVGKAMLGQGRALKEIGVSFKDTGSVAGNFDETVSALTEKVGGVGAAMGETAQGKAKILSTEFENLQETVGSKLSPALEKIIEVATKIVSWLTETPGALQGVSIALGVMAAAWLAMTIAASPWLLIGAAIAAVIAGVVLAVKNWGAISAWFSGVWNTALNAVKGWFSSVADWIGKRWDTLMAWFRAAGQAFSVAWNAVIDAIKGWFTGAADWIGQKWNAAVALIRAVIDGVIGWVKANWPVILAVITGPIGLAVLAIARHWDEIKAGAAAVIDWFGGMGGRIGGAVSGMWDGIVRSFKNAINVVIGLWNNFHLTLGGGSILGVSIPSITLDTPDIPYLASGGTIAQGGLAVVGERGPEIVSLPSGATVHPNGSGAGGPLDLSDRTIERLAAAMVRGVNALPSRMTAFA